MNTLINLVLSIVLNVLSYGTNQPENTFVSNHKITKTSQKQSFKLEDLRSNYLITKEEVTRDLVRIN